MGQGCAWRMPHVKVGLHLVMLRYSSLAWCYYVAFYMVPKVASPDAVHRSS